MSRTARSRLPEQVQVFIEEFAKTGDAHRAAVDVGVHPKRTPAFIREVMGNSDAREAFDQVMRTRFANAAPIAMNLLIEMVENKENRFDQRVRLEAAKDLLNRTGYSARGPGLQAPAEKDMREMSRDELLKVVNEGEAELAGRAKLIDNRSLDNTVHAEVVDLES